MVQLSSADGFAGRAYDATIMTAEPWSASAACAPAAVRAAILEEHAEIRRSMRRLQRNLSRMALQGGPFARDVQMNRSIARDLCGRVLEHMESEECLLVPVLESVDAWGSVRAARLVADHEQQRTLMQQWLAALDGDALAGAELDVLARALLDHVERDMQEEEATHLRADLLDDTGMPSSVETG